MKDYRTLLARIYNEHGTESFWVTGMNQGSVYKLYKYGLLRHIRYGVYQISNWGMKYLKWCIKNGKIIQTDRGIEVKGN